MSAPEPPTTQQLSQIAGKHGFAQQSIRPMPATGMVNWIYALGDAAVLRVSNDAHPDAIRDALTESVAVPAVRTAGIRTPQLLVVDDSRDIVEAICTIYERVPGHDLASQIAAGHAVPDRVYRELGRELAKLHRDVTAVPDPNGRLDDKRRWISPEAMDNLFRNAALDPHTVGVLTSLYERMRPVLQQASTFRRFLHQDLSLGNIMSNRDEFAALIDWGDAGWADPAREFAFLPLPAVDQALAGYREIMPLDGDDTAEARILWDHLERAVRGIGQPPAHNPGRADSPALFVDLIGFLFSGRGQKWVLAG